MRRNGESGYALMMVFLMAAVIAITLYNEIPRVAFQAQRQREQLLMERGEQYMRAIQVYMKANNNQYPRNMEDLEKGQNRRYLRHKYIDPITLKDEWRIIHVQNGVLTDSIFTKKQDQEKSASNPSSIGILPGVAQTAGGGQAGSPLDRRRANEGGMTSTATPGAPAPQSDDDGAPGATAQNQPGAQGQQGQPLPPGQTAQGGAAGQQPGVPGQMPQVPGGQVNPAIPGMTPGGVQRPGAQPIIPPGAGQAGIPGQQPQNRPQQQTQGNSSSIGVYPGVGGGTATSSGISPQPFGGQQTTPFGQQPTVFGGQPAPYPPQTGGGPGRGGSPQPGSANPALTAIQDQLTRPNPRGLAAVQQQQQQTSAFGGSSAFGSSGALAGAGAFVAGVASTAEYDAIMEYNGRTAYNEWEFVFDPAKAARVPQLGGTGAGGTPVGPGGSPVGQPGSSPFGQSGSAFGGSPFGGAGGSQFGQPGGQGARPGQQPGGQAGGNTGLGTGGGYSLGGAGGAFRGFPVGGAPGPGGMQGGQQTGDMGTGQQGGAGAAMPSTKLRLGKP